MSTGPELWSDVEPDFDVAAAFSRRAGRAGRAGRATSTASTATEKEAAEKDAKRRASRAQVAARQAQPRRKHKKLAPSISEYPSKTTARVASFIDHQHPEPKKRRPCAYCRTRPGTTLDHIWPKSRGGPGAAWNIVPACKPCNQRKGDLLLRETDLFLVVPRFLGDAWLDMPLRYARRLSGSLGASTSYNPLDLV